MENSSNPSTFTVRITDSESTKRVRKPALRISTEIKQLTKKAFDVFIVTYSGRNDSREILDAFVKSYPCYGYIQDMSRSAVFKIIGPLKSHVEHKTHFKPMRLDMPMPPSVESTKMLFHQFLVTYQPKIKFRKCLNDFIATDENAAYLNSLRDTEITEVLGNVKEWKDIQDMRNVFSDRVDSVEESSLHDQNASEGFSTSKRLFSESGPEGFPDKLYDFIEKNPHRYTKSRPARPIPGENDWIRSKLVNIMQYSHVQNRKEAINEFIKIYPRLSYLAKITPDQLQCRYGSFQDLVDEGKVGKPPHKRIKNGTGPQAVLQDFEGSQFPNDSPLHDLSPNSRRDIEAALYGPESHNTIADVAVVSEPSGASIQSAPKRPPRLQQCAARQIIGNGESGIDEDTFRREFGDVEFESNPMLSQNSKESTYIDIEGSVSIIRSVPFDSPVITGPRRSPRFVRVRASTPPVLQLRRSPRIAKQSGRSSYP